MKAYVITLENNENSQRTANRLKESAPIDIETFWGITPNAVDSIMIKDGLKWTYPWNKPVDDFASGLTLHPYMTAEPKKRIACFLSHYTLWKMCDESNEPFFIFEHDAIFIDKSLPVEDLKKSHYHIIGLNHPFKATRRASVYDQVIREGHNEDNYGIVRAPKIEDSNVPQGIAGNSAYFIKPEGAKTMLKLIKEYGCWPNDALMCRQLIHRLGATKKYYTKVQSAARSTTTL